MLLVGLALATQVDGPLPIDCRHLQPDRDRAAPTTKTFLPANDLFAPPIAAPKERRFYAGISRYVFDGHAAPTGERAQAINAGSVGAGASFGLWGLRTGTCDGVQINLAGVILSEFDLDSFSQNLINTDFLVGIPVTFRHGALSGRFRLYHQSSHLGDEFLLENPRFERFDFSFEALDTLISWEEEWVRIYGGAGVVIHQSNETDLDPLLLQGGFETRNALVEPWDGGFELSVVVGVDLQLLQERDFGVTASVKAGVDLTRRLTYTLRVLLTYLGGYVPFGQFTLSQTIHSFGAEAQFEF